MTVRTEVDAPWEIKTMKGNVLFSQHCGTARRSGDEYAEAIEMLTGYGGDPGIYGSIRGYAGPRDCLCSLRGRVPTSYIFDKAELMTSLVEMATKLGISSDSCLLPTH